MNSETASSRSINTKDHMSRVRELLHPGPSVNVG